MKKLLLFLMLLSAVCCTPEKTPEETGGVEIVVPIRLDGNTAKGNEQSLKIQTSSPWSASCSEDWISVNPKSGQTGTSAITIILKANNARSQRSGNVAIKCAEGTRNFTISQEADQGIFKLDDDKIVIESTTRLVEIPVYNELTEFGVSFYFFQEEGLEGWMSYAGTKVKDDGKRYLGFYTKENYDNQHREALIYVKSGEFRDTLQAIQKYYFEFNAPQSETIDFREVEEHWIEISTTLNYLGEVEVVEGQEWLRFGTYSNTYISISASENTTSAERRGKLRIKHDDIGINHTIEIIQQVRKSSRDRDFLISEIYNRVDQRDRNGLVNWNTNKPLNEWYGVKSEGENVTTLSLGFSYSQDISLDLRPLVDLQELKINANMYANHINVSNMVNLKRISLDGTVRYANIKSIDASGCTNLFVAETDSLFYTAVELNLDGVNLNEKIDISPYWLKSLKLGGPKLKDLKIHTNLNVLDFNNCKNIEKVRVQKTFLEKMYVDDLYYLNSLAILNGDNFMAYGKQIEVRHCESLVDFECSGFTNMVVVDCSNAQITKVSYVDHLKLAGVGDIEIGDFKSVEAIQCRNTKKFTVYGISEMEKVVFEQVSSQVCDIFLTFERQCKEVSITCPNVGKFELKRWVMDYPLDLTKVGTVRAFDFNGSTNLKKINFGNCTTETESFKMYYCDLFEGFDFTMFGSKMRELRMGKEGNWPIVEVVDFRRYAPDAWISIDNVKIKKVYSLSSQNVGIRVWSDGTNAYPVYIK